MRADRTRDQGSRGDPGTRKPAGADSSDTRGNQRTTIPRITFPPHLEPLAPLRFRATPTPSPPSEGERGKRNVRNAVEPVGTPVAAGRAVAQARTAIQESAGPESAGPGTDGAGNTPAGYPAYRADCPGPASTDTASPDSRKE